MRKLWHNRHVRAQIAGIALALLVNVSASQSSDLVEKTKKRVEPVAPVGTFMGAVYGAYQLADAGSFHKILDSHKVGLYLTTLSLAHVDKPPAGWPSVKGDGDKDRKRIIVTWHDVQQALEVDFDPRLTPSVPKSTYHNRNLGYVFLDVWGPAGFRPSLVTLNLPFATGKTEFFSSKEVVTSVNAIADLRKTTGARLIIPFVGANNGNYADFAHSSYFRSARKIIQSAGAVALDTPPNMFMRVYPAGYRDSTVTELRWARSHGIATLVLLSPYDVDGGANTTSTPQWGYDKTLLTATKGLVRYLSDHEALPTFWVVDNYSEQPQSNAPATEKTPDSIAQVALWVSQNAPTSPYPK